MSTMRTAFSEAWPDANAWTKTDEGPYTGALGPALTDPYKYEFKVCNEMHCFSVRASYYRAAAVAAGA